MIAKGLRPSTVLLLALLLSFYLAADGNLPKTEDSTHNDRNTGSNKADGNPKADILTSLLSSLLKDPSTLATVAQVMLQNASPDLFKGLGDLAVVVKQFLMMFNTGNEAGANDGTKPEGWVMDLAKEFLPPFSAADFIPIKAKEYFPKPLIQRLSTIQADLAGVKSIYESIEKFDSIESFLDDLKTKAPNVHTMVIDLFAEAKANFEQFYASLNEGPKNIFNKIIDTMSAHANEWFNALMGLSSEDQANLRNALDKLAPGTAVLAEKLVNNRAVLFYHLSRVFEEAGGGEMRDQFEELRAQLKGVFKQMTDSVARVGDDDEDSARRPANDEL